MPYIQISNKIAHFEDNLLGSKRKANNYYFAFILQVLYIGMQFARANSPFKMSFRRHVN